MVYKWKDGAPQFLKKHDVRVIAKAIEWVSKDGPLTAERIELAARAEDSPLHTFFEWDDAVAAERYRRSYQVHDLMHNIVVVIKEGERHEETIAFVAIGREQTEGRTGMMAPVTYALVDHLPAEVPARAEDAVDARFSSRVVSSENAWEDLIAWREKYGHLKEFLMVVKAIDITRSKVA